MITLGERVLLLLISCYKYGSKFGGMAIESPFRAARNMWKKSE